MEQILKQIGKFWFPVACIVVSLLLLKAGFTGEELTRQNNMALYGVLAILAIGIISLLFLLDVLKRPIVLALSVVFIAGAVFFGYSNFKTIETDIKFTEKKALIKGMVIQRLKDVRTAEVAFLESKGRYTNNWEELVDFIQNGKIQSIKSLGALPDSINNIQDAIELGMVQSMPEGMTDDQVRKAGIIVRDTIYDSAMKILFDNSKADERRRYPLDLSNFKYCPGTNNTVQLKLNAGDIDISGGGKRPVFACWDPEPFADEPLKVGSMDEAITNGNWKE